MFICVPSSLAADPTPLDAIHFATAPVRVRVAATIAGRPAEGVWADAAGRLFAFCDRDGNGTLDAKERAAFAPPRRGRNEVILDFPGQVVPDALELTFPEKADAVTKEMFLTALRAANRGPIVGTAIPGRADSEQLSAALFRTLDADKDGKLSASEFAAARDRLAALDVNEDEFVAAAELLNQAVAANRPQFVQAMRQPQPPADDPEYLFLKPGTPPVKQVLAARGGDRATTLNRSQTSASEAAFAALDKDANGKLDTAELQAWLDRAPDVAAAVAFPADGPPTQDVKGAATAPGLRQRFAPPAGGVADVRTAAKASLDGLRAMLKPIANDGAVTRKQVADANGPVAPALFDLADRDADGKVTVAESEAVLAVAAALAGCRVEVTFADTGRGLFELLDANGDGQLSPRELAYAAAAVTEYVGPSGLLAPADLPRRVTVRVGLASIGVGPLPAVRAAVPTPASAPTADPPGWFTKMDRNGDGDVSRREFLGPLDLFRKLDADADGLLSAAEARAAK